MVEAYKFLGGASDLQAGLVGQHGCPLQERTKQAQVLQFVHKAATDVLQWSEASMNVFSAVVCRRGGIGRSGTNKLNKLIRKLCGGDGAGQCGGRVREEDERKAESYNVQSLSSPLCQTEAAQKHVEPQTHSATWIEALGGPSHPVPPPHTQYKIIHYLWLMTDITVYINSLYVVGSHTVCLSEDFLHTVYLHEVASLPGLRPGPSHFSGTLWVFTSDKFLVHLWLQCFQHPFSNHDGEKRVFVSDNRVVQAKFIYFQHNK